MKQEVEFFESYGDAARFAKVCNEVSKKWIYRPEDHDGGWIVIRSAPLKSEERK